MGVEGKSTILIVEDDPGQLAGYREILAGLDAEILTSAFAAEALSLLAKNDVAVVLVGVSPHGDDGFELANRICGNPRLGETAILFLSRTPLADAEQMHRYSGCLIDYLPVPVIPEVLHSKVRTFVDLHAKTRMLDGLNGKSERRVHKLDQEPQPGEAELRTRADLLELASEAIIARDLKGSIQFWSTGAENLYGWNQGEVMGRNMHALLQTVFPVSHEAAERELLETGNWRGNLVQRTRGGQEIVVACRKTLNRDRDAVLEVNRDITSQLLAEQALRESEKMAVMGRMAGVIAHEINNPLSAVTNILYLLHNHSSLDEDALHYLESAEKELARVAQITRQTLSFYREAREPVPIDMHELVEDVLEMQKPAIQAAGITVSKKFLATSTIMGFPMELRQVLLNLVTNAIQAMAKGGTLRLYVHEATDWRSGLRGPAISVLDTGAGIRREDAKHLFEPFFSTKAAKGNGLGLWISKGILQKYNGRISYRSHSLNGRSATCFRVVLLGAPAAGSVATAEAPAPDAAQQRMRGVSAAAGAGPLSEPIFAPCR
ncbi:MAG TPA: ATP-binding protein [Terracidiphilus sp.]|nr:ATP-binding protein [Terracidiphilus sp.]